MNPLDLNNTPPANDEPIENDPLKEDISSLTETPDIKGMDTGTKFKEDREQDLDDLIHKQAALKRNEIPPPDES